MFPSSTGHAHWSVPELLRSQPGRNRSPKPENWIIDMRNMSMSAKLCLKGESQTSICYHASADNEQTVLLVNIVTTMIMTQNYLRVMKSPFQINVHVQYYDLTAAAVWNLLFMQWYWVRASQNPTISPMCPAKTQLLRKPVHAMWTTKVQISLHIHAAWSAAWLFTTWRE